METRRYKAYNSTRGTVLNSKLAIANRELEPLKFLELLIGGLGLDSESGVWLKPLAGAPQVPRVFPFDLVFLDQNERVIQSAEIFPSSDLPQYSDETASAMVLPLHAALLSQTLPGDLLLMQDLEGAEGDREQPAEAAGEATEVKATAPAVAEEVAVVPLEVVASGQKAEEAPPASGESLPSMPSGVAEEKAPEDVELSVPALAAVESTPQVDAELSALTPPAGAPTWEVPLEGFWSPPAKAEESATRKSKGLPKPEGDARIEADKPQPEIAAPSAPAEPENAGPVEKERNGRAPGATASTSRPVIQSVGFTFSQYRNWQVANATPPAAPLETQKSTDQGPTAKEGVDSKQSAAEPESKGKLPQKTGNAPGGQSAPDSHVKWAELTSRTTGKPGKPGSNARRTTAARKDLQLSAAKETSTPQEPKAAPGKEEAKEPIQTENSNASHTAPALNDPTAELREPSLPLWKSAPNPAEIAAKASTNSQDSSESTKQPVGGDDAPTSQADQGDRVKRSKPPVEKVTKKPEQPKFVVEPAAGHPSHASRVPEAISKLMTALHRIGGSDQQPTARQELAANGDQSSWLIPDALHRDRRRAVRRTVPGLVAYYFTGGAPQPYTISDISATGFFLITRDQWMPETMILMTLQKPSVEGKKRKESITVLCKVVRRGEEGIGAEFVMPETLDPNSRDIKPSRATDRMALAQFLFSGEPDDLEILGVVVVPAAELAAGEQIETQEEFRPD